MKNIPPLEETEWTVVKERSFKAPEVVNEVMSGSKFSPQQFSGMQMFMILLLNKWCLNI